MILDSSAVVAILTREPDAATFLHAIEAADSVGISAATLVEASIVLGPRGQRPLTEFLAEAGIEIVGFDANQADVARRAHHSYGRGSGSKARLNFGDCFSYALAKSTGRPLLFKGDDFTHTDIEPAS